jgi:hypothetical protein
MGEDQRIAERIVFSISAQNGEFNYQKGLGIRELGILVIQNEERRKMRIAAYIALKRLELEWCQFFADIRDLKLSCDCEIPNGAPTTVKAAPIGCVSGAPTCRPR